MERVIQTGIDGQWYNGYDGRVLSSKYIKSNVMSSTKFSDVKEYLSNMSDDNKKMELLDEIGEDFIQTYLRRKKINRIIKR